VDRLLGADPYPNEHSCQLRDPKTFNIVGSGERKSDDKTYRVIFGKPKGGGGSVEQAYRYPIKEWTEKAAHNHCNQHHGTFEPANKENEGDTESDQEEDDREKLHEAAKAREKRYGIKFREGKGHLTTPEGYPQNEEDYGDPVNYKYPLKAQDRCQNALSQWSQYREEYTQPERNTIYERIVKAALEYNIAVKYNFDLPEARGLPTNIKDKLEGFKSAGDMIQRVNVLTAELQT
jgi:hypothetical protein